MSQIDQARWPSELRVAEAGRVLRILFGDGQAFDLSAEYLRVMSPSADVQGHGPSERKVVGRKRQVAITAAEPVGHYAVKLRFSDGHDTGLFTWTYLFRLGTEQSALWAGYLRDLEARGLSRD